MKRVIAILALAVVLALLIPSGRALGSVSCAGNYCDVTTDSIEYRYFPNDAITLRDYGVATDGGGKHIVFTLIQAGLFETSEPDEHGRTVSIMGSRASIETHDGAHATLIYRASQYSNVTFSLDSGIGAVSFGSSAIIGDSEMLADMTVTEGRTIEKSVDNVMVGLQPGDVLAFRVQGPSGSLGSLLASGDLDAELDVRTVGPTVDSDLTAFRSTATMTVDSVASDRASFSFSGLGTSPVIIVDLSNDLYAPLKDSTVVKVDGQTLIRFDDMKDFLGSSQKGFAVAEGPDYAEVLVRLDTQSGSLTIEKISLDPLLVVAVLMSISVCVAAAVFLFRRKTH